MKKVIEKLTQSCLQAKRLMDELDALSKDKNKVDAYKEKLIELGDKYVEIQNYWNIYSSLPKKDQEYKKTVANVIKLTYTKLVEHKASFPKVDVELPDIKASASISSDTIVEEPKKVNVKPAIPPLISVIPVNNTANLKAKFQANSADLFDDTDETTQLKVNEFQERLSNVRQTLTRLGTPLSLFGSTISRQQLQKDKQDIAEALTTFKQLQQDINTSELNEQQKSKLMNESQKHVAKLQSIDKNIDEQAAKLKQEVDDRITEIENGYTVVKAGMAKFAMDINAYNTKFKQGVVEINPDEYYAAVKTEFDRVTKLFKEIAAKEYNYKVAIETEYAEDEVSFYAQAISAAAKDYFNSVFDALAEDFELLTYAAAQRDISSKKAILEIMDEVNDNLIRLQDFYADTLQNDDAQRKERLEKLPVFAGKLERALNRKYQEQLSQQKLAEAETAFKQFNEEVIAPAESISKDIDELIKRNINNFDELKIFTADIEKLKTKVRVYIDNMDHALRVLELNELLSNLATDASEKSLQIKEEINEALKKFQLLIESLKKDSDKLTDVQKEQLLKIKTQFDNNADLMRQLSRGFKAELEYLPNPASITAENIKDALAQNDKLREIFDFPEERVTEFNTVKAFLLKMQPELAAHSKTWDEALADYLLFWREAQAQLCLRESQALLAAIKDAVNSRQQPVPEWSERLQSNLKYAHTIFSEKRDTTSLAEIGKIQTAYKKLTASPTTPIATKKTKVGFFEKTDKTTKKADGAEVDFTVRVKGYVEHAEKNNTDYTFKYADSVNKETPRILSVAAADGKKATLEVTPKEIVGRQFEDYKHMFAIAAQHPKEYYYFDGKREDLEIMIEAFKEKYNEVLKDHKYDALQLETMLYKRFKVREEGQQEYVSLEALSPNERLTIGNR